MKVPDGMPSISPVLFYTDLSQACDWLCNAFGFVERTDDRITNEQGIVEHAELVLGNGLIILSNIYDEFKVPTQASVHHQVLYVFVDSVDAHSAHAAKMGALISSPPADTNYGARVYGVQDYQGYHWIFAQQL